MKHLKRAMEHWVGLEQVPSKPADKKLMLKLARFDPVAIRMPKFLEGRSVAARDCQAGVRVLSSAQAAAEVKQIKAAGNVASRRHLQRYCHILPYNAIKIILLHILAAYAFRPREEEQDCPTPYPCKKNYFQSKRSMLLLFYHVLSKNQRVRFQFS